MKRRLIKHVISDDGAAYPGTCPAEIKGGNIGIPGKGRIGGLGTASRCPPGKDHRKPPAGYWRKLSSLVDNPGDGIGETAAFYPVYHH